MIFEFFIVICTSAIIPDISLRSPPWPHFYYSTTTNKQFDADKCHLYHSSKLSYINVTCKDNKGVEFNHMFPSALCSTSVIKKRKAKK